MPVSQSRQLLDVLLRSASDDQSPVKHVEHLPPRPGRAADWPDWADPALVSAFATRGISRPWLHQTEAAEFAEQGQDVVIATGTASGKSLAYQLPAISRILADPQATVLYLAPTKALAADQLKSLGELDLPDLMPALYDGDTPVAQRDWVRSSANWILTNPDMLHRGILPHHARWGRLLKSLKFIIIDECHYYRGVFGSHVALVLRRLQRLTHMYGAEPVFILASATAADPATSAERLIGRPTKAITVDSSPRAGADFVLWEPAVIPDLVGENGAPVRRSAAGEAARILAELVANRTRTLAFVRSRQGAEQTAISARRRLSEINPALVDRVAAYRGGYLPEERRELEQALATGELLGVASTNALELGMDISGLDAALLAGYPGTLASVWQQAGRAGRGSEPALVVFIAREDPLDSYLINHPEAIFGRSVEATIFDPTNKYILGPHLACAAAEKHLTADDLQLFGGPSIRPLIDQLVADRVLRQRPHGWYYTEVQHPAEAVDIRGGGAGQVAIVETRTGRMLGTVDAARATGSVHPGAVHLHQGNQYLVETLDLDHGVAYVAAAQAEWSTVARTISQVTITQHQRMELLASGIRIGLAETESTEQVVGYLRRRPNGELIDSVPLDLPEQKLATKAVWYTIPFDVLAAAGITDPMIPGVLHAAEHAAIGLLPLFAGCDRWDIGGLSTNLHPDTGQPTVLVYDGFPGGAGFADRGFDVLLPWLTATKTAVESCPCLAGCPSCVQSPKCGNGNMPLDKSGAVTVLGLMTRALGGKD